MPTAATIMAELKAKASEKTRATYIRHGAPANRTLGVSVADMKLIAKTIKKQQALACEIYDTGIFDAMYLAGIVADGAQLSTKQLQTWTDATAGMPMISEYTVPWVAVENPEGRALAVKWVTSKKEHVASAGWCTYSGLVATTPDNALDLDEIETLLKKIPTQIQAAANRARYTMNGFVIAVGVHVGPLLKQAMATAKAIGNVSVDVGDTACEVPVAVERIEKVRAGGRAAKRKTIRC
ncbi:MAG TPA: DNA alkylation repair protein [Acidobacteriaceae bacterium]|jgi:3-methyladenine DNA glycosylase AlkD